MEQQWCGKTQLSVHQQKVQHLINILQHQDTKTKSVSRTLHYFRSVGLLNA